MDALVSFLDAFPLLGGGGRYIVGALVLLAGFAAFALGVLLLEGLIGAVFYARLFRRRGRSRAWGLWGLHPVAGVWGPMLAFHLLEGEEANALLPMRLLMYSLILVVLSPLAGAVGVFAVLALPSTPPTALPLASALLLASVFGAVMLAFAVRLLVILNVALRTIRMRGVSRTWLVPALIPGVRLWPLFLLAWSEPWHETPPVAAISP